MILQSLVDHYEALAKLGKIAPPGWGEMKISCALCIDESGHLEQVVSLKTEQKVGKKMTLVPQRLILPAPVKRSSGISANFLCDNATYLLGILSKDKAAEDDPEKLAKQKRRAKECFLAAKELHETILADTDCPAAHALLSFFRTWNPETAELHPTLQDCLDDLTSGGNMVFRFAGAYIHEDTDIRAAWDHYSAEPGSGPEMVCLVTGEKGPVEAVHPPIKGVQGAQSSGAALISFNAPAFCSYRKEQDYNAPVGKYAAFAYTTALNHLLADREHICHMGDATVLCWAKSGDSAYQDMMGCFAFDQPSSYDENDLRQMVHALCQGESVAFEESQLDPDMEFYILGLSPNASRLSVRFFLRNSFGAFLRNVMEHHQRMEIERPAYEKSATVPLWKLLRETVNLKSTNKNPVPNLAGETLRAILNNTRYPAQLLQGINLRIRAEQELNRNRAGLIKAYYLKNSHKDVPKEVLTVSLNSESNNIPYTLGRLFSVLEAVQSSANPGINSTIKDRYFNAASATPAHVFPTLLNLAQKHMKKINGGLAAYYDKQITDLMGRLGETYPAHLSIPEQGAFQLGYYHQTQARYAPKNKEEN